MRLLPVVLLCLVLAGCISGQNSQRPKGEQQADSISQFFKPEFHTQHPYVLGSIVEAPNRQGWLLRLLGRVVGTGAGTTFSGEVYYKPPLTHQVVSAALDDAHPHPLGIERNVRDISMSWQKASETNAAGSAAIKARSNRLIQALAELGLSSAQIESVRYRCALYTIPKTGVINLIGDEINRGRVDGEDLIGYHYVTGTFLIETANYDITNAQILSSTASGDLGEKIALAMGLPSGSVKLDVERQGSKSASVQFNEPFQYGVAISREPLSKADVSSALVRPLSRQHRWVPDNLEP